MSTVYSINYTDPLKGSFNINPAQINGFRGPKSNSSLILHGTGRLKYGEAINENFLHLLENFASPARTMPLVISIQEADNSGALGTNLIKIFDDKTNIFIQDFEFQVVNSTSAINDNTYTVVSSSYQSSTNLTTIIINESFPDDQAAFVGNVSYSIIEPDPNLVKPPYNEGQLWFNKTNGILYIYKDISGSGVFQWDNAGKLAFSTEQPRFPVEGDLWYDTVLDQLMVYQNGSFQSVAERYVLKSGDVIDSTGIINFSTHLVINEGAGNDLVGSDIRATGNLLSSAEDSVILNIDSNNDSNGKFIIAKGSNNSTSSTLLFSIGNNGVLHSEVPNYQTLLTNNNDIPNKLYVDTSITNSINNLGSVYLSKGDDTGWGNHQFYSTDVSGSYSNDAIEIREVNLVGTSQTTSSYAPSISFNWDGITQSQLALESDGVLRLRNGVAGSHNIMHGMEVGTFWTNQAFCSIPLANINNNSHLTTKEYVDNQVSSITGGNNLSAINPSSPKTGDILVTGTGATLEIFIYGDGAWRKIFPAVYSV